MVKTQPTKESLDVTNEHRTEYKDYACPSTEPQASFALILKADIMRLPEIVRSIELIPGTRIVYQRVSAGRLRIEEEKLP